MSQITIAMQPSPHVIDDALRPGGLVGQISFTRLAALFRAANETTESEEITHFVLAPDEGVIKYVVRTKV